MGRAATGAHAGPGEYPAHDVTDGGRTRQANARCEHSQEDLARYACAPVLAYVERQGLSDIREQWEPALNPALPSDDDFPGPPENVAQFQRDYLSCTQTKAREKEQDRVVTSPAWRGLISSRKDTFHLVGRKKGGYLCLAPFADRGNRKGKIGSRFFAEVKKAKE